VKALARLAISAKPGFDMADTPRKPTILVIDVLSIAQHGAWREQLGTDLQ
jgi:hypothetical protein